MRYHHASDGEWIRPTQPYSYMKCCTCGQVHKLEVRVKHKQVEMRMWMINRPKAKGESESVSHLPRQANDA